jgi:hypothetical protein
MNDINLYINFVLHAVYGRLAEADIIMRTARQSIRHVADFLSAKHPIAPKPLYRGMLLDPARPLLRTDAHYTFASWSEDRDVARWFASPQSIISAPLVEHDARLRGYVATLPTPRAHVLFHYSWASVFGDFAALALQHPFMGHEGQRQIAWSLRTQREVITAPVDDLVTRPIEELPGPSVVELDRKLAPPWVLESESAS